MVVKLVELLLGRVVTGVCAEKRRVIFPQVARLPGIPSWAI